jgi:predicted NBD/HSP70 family sugar kinase
VPWRRVDALSLGTPGVQNADGTIRLADNVRGLDEVRVAAALRRLLRIEVRVENDVNMAALGEFEHGVAKGCRNFVLLAIGTGVGMGVMVDGRIIRGSRGAAGEVAYLPIGAVPSAPASLRRGAFEVAAAGSGVCEILKARLSRQRRLSGTSLHAGSSAREVYGAAALGDRLAADVVREHAELVAHAVLGVASVVDPELVVMGGGIGSNPVLLAPLRDAVSRITPWPIRVESSSLGPDAGLIGAVHHARRSLPEVESARVSARLQSGELE